MNTPTITNRLETAALETDFERDLSQGQVPFSEYPRPQMRRDSYLCLNGKWDLSIQNGGKTVFSGQILVPFPPESRISGLMREIQKNDTLIYSRRFCLEEAFVQDRILLHIGACDQYASVLVNDRPVGENVGGYLPFSFDITDFVTPGENTLTIRARDPLDRDLPYGKQTAKPGGMWYTKVSGIWQTVWLESVPDDYIRDIRITPDLTGIDLEVVGGCAEKTLHFGGKTYTFTGDRFRLEVEDPICWTPDHPHLYTFSLHAGADSVTSYFGLRTVSIETRGDRAVILLNGRPIFCHGLLDQGYFPDGIFLPASPRGFQEDILKMKACGFNMLRKHIKLEPECFYYYCDKYGMLVFQDMINSGKYSFLLDTALPTVGVRRMPSRRASKTRRAVFEQTGRGILARLHNHPSVVYYTIFNEGWGQYDADGCYRLFKSIDPTRVYDATSGWFKKQASDVESDHVYFKPVKLRPVPGRPMVLSEFGGYSCKIEGHAFHPDKAYGYKYFHRREEFEEALLALYENEVLPMIEKGLCACVLTQVSDVEDETNGLLTYDRRVRKVDAEKMRDLSEKLYERFAQQFGGR